jgi:glutathione S-transferase
MKLYHSPTSPFVRKCLVCARETGLIERITLEPAAAHPVARDRALVAHNPLGQVPTLITDDGSVLYDSRVICEYFDELSGGRLLPPRGAARLDVLIEQALADGLLDAAVLTRYETAVRPEALRWPDWVTGQLDKVSAALAELERAAPKLGARVDLGTISIACRWATSIFATRTGAGATAARRSPGGSTGLPRASRCAPRNRPLLDEDS